jgi:ABC-type phosphate transport system substrate-binding protein
MKPIYFLAAAMSLLLAAPAMAGDIVVIVNKANANSIDKNLIVKVYSGETKSWAGGGAITSFDLPDSNAERGAFAEQVMGRTTGNMKSLWAQNVFTGKAVPPKVVDSDEAVKKAVAANPGAIGYIKSSSVDDSVKVVLK